MTRFNVILNRLSFRAADQAIDLPPLVPCVHSDASGSSSRAVQPDGIASGYFRDIIPWVGSDGSSRWKSCRSVLLRIL